VLKQKAATNFVQQIPLKMCDFYTGMLSVPFRRL